MGAARLPRPALIVVVALVMGACSDSSATQGTQTSSSTTATVPVASSSSPSPSPSASADPASAAKAAYIAYERAIDKVYQQGGANAEKELPKVAALGKLSTLLEQARALRKDGARQEGGAAIKRLTVKSVSKGTSKKLPQVTLTACVDYSSQKFVDSSGRPIGSSNSAGLFSAFVVVTDLGKQEWRVTTEENQAVKTC